MGGEAWGGRGGEGRGRGSEAIVVMIETSVGLGGSWNGRNGRRTGFPPRWRGGGGRRRVAVVRI